ncbi:MAG: hypothetical protein GX234_11560 [Clostridiales bacterium]|nr:hypothetical protein [Clostridiales bacterium]
MKPNKKLFAVMLAAILWMTLTLSFIFIIQNAHHHCSGDECPICVEIEAAINTISGFKAVPVSALAIAVLCVFTQLCAETGESVCVKNTLITLKVELLN